jgi:hypothetical protein
MKVYNKEEFLKLPDPLLYCEYSYTAISPICIKYETRLDTGFWFYSQLIGNVIYNNQEQLVNSKCDQIHTGGEEYYCFDQEEYLVFDKQDILELIKTLTLIYETSS